MHECDAIRWPVLQPNSGHGTRPEGQSAAAALRFLRDRPGQVLHPSVAPSRRVIIDESVARQIQSRESGNLDKVAVGVAAFVVVVKLVNPDAAQSKSPGATVRTRGPSPGEFGIGAFVALDHRVMGEGAEIGRIAVSDGNGLRLAG